MDGGPAERENVSQRLPAFAFGGAFAFFSEGIAASAFGFGVGAAAVEAFFATTDAKVAGEPFSRSRRTSLMNPTPSVGA